MKVSSLNLFTNVPLYILHNFGMLVLVVSPLLLLLPSFNESKNRLEKLYHILKSVRKVNEYINKEANSHKILSKACEILMDSGEYRNVTVYNNRLEKISESGVKFIEEVPTCVRRSFNKSRRVLLSGPWT